MSASPELATAAAASAMSATVTPTTTTPTTATTSSTPLEKTTAHSAQTSTEGDEENEDDYVLPSDVADRLVKRTEMRVSQVLSQSDYVQKNCYLYDLPRFEREDLEIGEMIAYGGFSNVHEILSFKSADTELLQGDKAGRRYIIKNLNPKLALNPKKLVVGAKDLVMEAHFLSSLDHENVIQLKAWSAAGIAGFAETGRADGFFLVFDRLMETLSRRISTWRDRAKETKKGPLMKGRTNLRMQLFTERIQVAMDIANAVGYLHSKRIIYRDLKPANIGFDEEGVLKIFDFGLAVELPEGSDINSTFNLAGNTGTSRYMAIEVIRKHPYNCKADVFSYSILLWELMALCKPYDGLVGQQVKECVSLFGERPAIPRTWPTNLRRILRRGWTESLLERPHIWEVHDTLQKLLEASGKPAKLFSAK
jgi:serine/threonine protein kinase